MKNISILFLILSSASFSQSPEKEAYYIKRIIATEFENGDTVNHHVTSTYLDSSKNIIKDENSIENAISGDPKYNRKIKGNDITVKVSETPQKLVTAEIDSEGDTLHKLIRLYDENGNEVQYFQIRGSDTVSAQKRTYDDRGNNINLYTKYKDRNKYYLSFTHKYDKHDNLKESKYYNGKRNLVRHLKFKYKNTKHKKITKTSRYVYGKGFVKYSLTIKEENVSTTYYYYDITAFNYGIQLKHYNGGYSIYTYNEQDKVTSRKMYDANDELVASVYFTFEKVK